MRVVVDEVEVNQIFIPSFNTAKEAPPPISVYGKVNTDVLIIIPYN